MTDSTDRQQAKGVENRPRDEFDRLFESELDYVCHTLRRFGVRDADIEDVAQELFFTVFERFDSYDRARPVRPWLVAFAFRAAANYRRRAHHRESTGSISVSEQGVSEQGSDSEITKAVEALDLINRMELDRRAVLILHDVDGFTAPEVSDALSIPLNTVYSRLRAARAEYRALSQHEVTE